MEFPESWKFSIIKQELSKETICWDICYKDNNQEYSKENDLLSYYLNYLKKKSSHLGYAVEFK